MTQSNFVSRRDVWAARLRRYQQCGSTVAQFCRDEGVSVPSFYQWKRRLADSSESTPTKFVPLVTTKSPALTTLKLPGGGLVELPRDMAREQLTEIFAACMAATTAHDSREGRS
jgi:transposase-like protein